MEKYKKAVHDFWNKASCGEALYLQGNSIGDFQRQAVTRYQLEPFIEKFADFENCQGKKVLEIGVGLGADHQRFAEAGSDLTGIDLTDRAIRFVQQRMNIMGLHSNLYVGDAENIPFKSNLFDEVYSWGVLHHSPDTPKAINEVFRVVKEGGKVKIMVYHRYSIVGFMLWTRYGLFRMRLLTSLTTIYDKFLESPGTKAYSIKEAYGLFQEFSKVKIDTVLCHGDLLTSDAGQKHSGVLLTLARKFWPRWLIKFLLPKNGLFMLISAEK